MKEVNLQNYTQLMHAYDHLSIYKERALDRFRPSPMQLEQRRKAGNDAEFLEQCLLKPEEYEKYGQGCFDKFSKLVQESFYFVNDEMKKQEYKESVGTAFRRVTEQISEQLKDLNSQRPMLKE